MGEECGQAVCRFIVEGVGGHVTRDVRTAQKKIPPGKVTQAGSHDL